MDYRECDTVKQVGRGQRDFWLVQKVRGYGHHEDPYAWSGDEVDVVRLRDGYERTDSARKYRLAAIGDRRVPKGVRPARWVVIELEGDPNPSRGRELSRRPVYGGRVAAEREARLYERNQQDRLGAVAAMIGRLPRYYRAWEAR